MAQPATIRTFTIELSDVDRAVYETLELRVAQHPSESLSYMMTRVLAFALNAREGLAFSGGGVSSTDEPALAARDLTGALTLWIEVGLPSAERLGKATRACGEVQVWAHRDTAPLEKSAKKRGIPRIERVAVYRVPDVLLRALEARLQRKNQWSIVRTDDEVMITVLGETLEANLRPSALSPL